MRTRTTTIVFAALVAVVISACSNSSFDGANDPLADRQYAIDQLGMQGAWDLSDGSDAVIAIIDTGIDLEHPDLAGHVVDGWDFVDDDDTPNDENGHGTSGIHLLGTPT